MSKDASPSIRRGKNLKQKEHSCKQFLIFGSVKGIQETREHNQSRYLFSGDFHKLKRDLGNPF